MPHPVLGRRRKYGGSVVPAWVPTDLDGFTVWLAARLETGFSDGDPVPQWTDQTGNGNHATQAAGGNRATFQSDAGSLINGQPVIRFDDTNPDFFDLAGFTATQSLFFVFTTPTNGRYYVSGAGANAFRNVIRFSGGDFDVIDAEGTTGSGVLNNGAGTYVYCVTADVTGLVNTYVNSAADAVNVNLATVGPYTRIGVANDEATSPIDADVAEVLLYNSVLSGADRLLVETYLNGIYALY